MAACVQLSGLLGFHLRCHASSSSQSKTLAHRLSSSSSSYSCEASSLRSVFQASRLRWRASVRSTVSGTPFVAASITKLSETELVSISSGLEGIEARFPTRAGVYGVYDKDGDLQFIGISRNVAASISTHFKKVPNMCYSVKPSLLVPRTESFMAGYTLGFPSSTYTVLIAERGRFTFQTDSYETTVGLVDGDNPNKTVLTEAWKSWLEEHLAITGKIPPGNQSGNNTWVRIPQSKPDLRMTPGRHVQLSVSLEELINRLVKENKIVAFIKGSRSSPQCGFSQRVVGILESHGADFECVDVLDEEHNFGLRDALKKYSNWPTFPQVFVRGELVGGCDIISSMAEKGELSSLLAK